MGQEVTDGGSFILLPVLFDRALFCVQKYIMNYIMSFY